VIEVGIEVHASRAKVWRQAHTERREHWRAVGPLHIRMNRTSFGDSHMGELWLTGGPRAEPAACIEANRATRGRPPSQVASRLSRGQVQDWELRLSRQHRAVSIVCNVHKNPMGIYLSGSNAFLKPIKFDASFWKQLKKDL